MASSQIAHSRIARHQTSGRSHIKMSATFRAVSYPSKLQLTSSSVIASIAPLNTTNARLHSTFAATARTSVLSVRSERSYIMIKPDGVQRGLVGGIISRFENKGFKLVGLKMFQCTKAIAEEHYKDLSSKPFFRDLVDYIISGPVICMTWEGNGVVKSARKLIGATNPLESEPGTIRGDLAIQTGRNVVHGSDSPENGEREIGLWFKSEEILAWNSVMMPWLTE